MYFKKYDQILYLGAQFTSWRSSELTHWSAQFSHWAKFVILPRNQRLRCSFTEWCGHIGDEDEKGAADEEAVDGRIESDDVVGNGERDERK